MRVQVGGDAHAAAGGGGRSHPPSRALPSRHGALVMMPDGMEQPAGGQQPRLQRPMWPQPAGACQGAAAIPTCL